jgi:hypothetical protein
MRLFLWLAAAALTAVLGLWLAYHVARAIWTGTANVHNDRVSRNDRPVYYWTAVFVQAAFAIALLVTLARVLSR